MPVDAAAPGLSEGRRARRKGLRSVLIGCGSASLLYGAHFVISTSFISAMPRDLDKSVPLTMGSQLSRVVDVGPFKVTEARFAPNVVLPPHVHDRTTFAVMLDGSFDLCFAGASYDCSSSIVFTEPLGEKHGNRIGTGGARVLVLQPDHRQVEQFRPCRHLFDQITHVKHAGIKALALRMVYELRASDSTRRLALQGLGFEMLSIAARSTTSWRSPPPAWLLRAMEHVRSTFLDDLDLDHVAAAADVHPAHLARAFRKHYRQSIGSFVRNLRLDWAASRLASTEDAIAEIALDAGFADQSHFTRAFKSRTGFTPGRFRKVVRD